MREPRPDSQLRARAFERIAPIYQEDKPEGYFTGVGVFQSLGATEVEAHIMMAELASILDHNELSGGMTALPEFDPDTPISPEVIYDSEWLRGSAFFTLGYVADATERADHSAVFLGYTWLGNSSTETQQLLEGFQADPSSVSRFLRWAFDNDPSLEEMLTEFEEKAASKTLRPPSFE